MTLPLQMPFAPMEALAQPEIPAGSDWVFEPKWDGFRCLAFKDGKRIRLQSKSGQPLDRYFPEIVEAMQALSAPAFVLDGELVIARGRKISFDDLLQRIHPAASRIQKLSMQTPATFIVFDMLVDEHRTALIDRPFAARRDALEAFARRALRSGRTLRLSPQTANVEEAKRWFRRLRDALDGIVAKDRRALYESGRRSGAITKVKNLRTADCVVGGFRYAARGQEIGSLLLGLYDNDHRLNHVGFTSSLSREERHRLKKSLEPLIKPPGFTGSAPGGPSRWSTKRSAEWKPLEPKLVAEVQYDHFTGGRFRHGTKFLRWRPDKAPEQCVDRQVVHESAAPMDLL